MIVVIPMSGQGSRFQKAGIMIPKPLIDVKGSWMLDWALKSIHIEEASKLIFVIRKEHEEKYGIADVLKEKYGNKTEVVCLFEESPTGAATSVLVAKEHINNDEDLLVKDCDGYIVSDIAETIRKNRNSGADGILSTTNIPGDRFSFVKLGEDGFATEVREKQRISDHVITGMYYFRRGSDFVTYARRMVNKGNRVNNEFYMAPVYEEMIRDGKKIVIDECEALWDLGTPESLAHFLENHKSA